MVKKTTLILLVSAVFYATAYCGDTPQDAAGKANEKVEELISKAEHSLAQPYELNSTIIDLRDAMMRQLVATDVRRDAAKRLIKIYNSLGDSGIDDANRKRILDAIGDSDNSPESHEFFLRALDSTDGEIRLEALRNINPNGVHGDDIYDKVKELEKKGLLSEAATLIHLGRANPARAIKEVVRFLKTTQSLRRFVSVSLDLPYGYYDDPDTLDVIIDRYEEFKSKPPQDKESVGYTPDRAISFKYLWKYVDAREGKRLKIALSILRDQGVCGESDLPQLANKISSNNQITRRAVAEFLQSQVFSGNLKKEKVLPILEDARNKEANPELRQRLSAILKEFGAGGHK